MSTVVAVPEVTTEVKKENLLDKAMLLVVTRQWPPLSKTISSKVLNSTAEASMIAVNKKLFNSKELRNILSNEYKLDEYLKHRASPMPLRKSWHLLGVDLFHDVEQKFTEHVQKRNQLIDEFIAVYDEAVSEAKQLLGDQFNPNDYPTKEKVRNYFHFSYNYWQFSVNEKLDELNKEVAQRKSDEFHAEIKDASEAARQLLRTQMKELVAHMVDRLKPTGETNEDGSEKKKIFRDSMLTKISDFLSVFEARNLAGDNDLKELVVQAKSLTQGVTAEVIRNNDALRSTLAENFEKIKQSLDSMITDQPTRAIEFD